LPTPTRPGCAAHVYGDKRIIFKGDADAAIVVAGHFFQVVACVSVSWLHWMKSKGYKVKRKTVRLRIVAGQSCFQVLEKMLRQYVKSSGRRLEHLW